MAEGISFRMITKDFDFGIAQRRARMPRAAMWAVREAGRVAKKAAQAKTPVLQDGGTSVAQMRRDIRFQSSGGIGPTISATGGPVRGLLKASIRPSKRLKQHGTAEFSMKVGPRGPRAYLYAAKIEERAGYMAAADDAAGAALAVIAEQAFNRVWKG